MKKARLILAAASAAALSLTGCAHSASTAAQVGSVVVTDVEVDRAANALASAQQTKASEFVSRVVAYEVLGLVAEKVAADQGIALTDQARSDSLDEATKALRTNPDLASLVDRTADGSIVYKKLGYDKWVEACQKVEVSVNPRYGTWSPALCSVVPDGSSLSKSTKAQS